ncbi:MAG: hypothetical protein QOI34_1954 [Verrucomicrobiota bacterium]
MPACESRDSAKDDPNRIGQGFIVFIRLIRGPTKISRGKNLEFCDRVITVGER